MDDEELDLGIRCLAVPVFGPPDEIAAAISLSGTVSEIHEDNSASLIGLLNSSAAAIESAWDPGLRPTFRHALPPVNRISHKPSIGTSADAAETSLCATLVATDCLDTEVAQTLSLPRPDSSGRLLRFSMSLRMTTGHSVE